MMGKMIVEEVKPLGEETPIYRSVGKMFILVPKQKVMEDTEKGISLSEENLAKLEKQKEYLISQINQNEQHLKEIFASGNLK